VIEFFTRDEKANEQRYRAFFGILGEHLGNVLSRQKASAREQEQSLQLASSAKMATLGKFAAGIAHEINDPLSTICTTVQILERMQHNAQKHSPDASLQPELEHLQRLHRGLKQIRRIISSLQSFSRDSSHDAYSKVSLAILVEHTIDLCSARFTNKGICLHIKPISPTLTIECRSSQISQVLLNLLTTAFDAAIDTTEKWVSLEVHEKDSEIEIWVTDSGQGIEPHLAGRIMSPFFTTKPPGKGTGLGLSIASSIISEHAGELFVNHSTPNTTFVIRLPRQAVRTAKAV
jgi:C4-dicarboxylate-specific signal transduction histidine kinase